MSEKDSRRRRRLSQEEDALWREVTRGIAPLPPPRIKAAPSASPQASDPTVPPKLPHRKSPALAPKAVASEPPPLARLERRLKQKLSRGRERVESRLDLHGHTQDEAYEALLAFLRRAQGKGATLVLVITGKGRGSGGVGVLQRQVPLWLGLPALRSYVVGFDQASVAHGGEGALYVRLRKPKSREA